MAVPLLNKAIVKKRVKQFKRPQSDHKVSVKVGLVSFNIMGLLGSVGPHQDERPRLYHYLSDKFFRFVFSIPLTFSLSFIFVSLRLTVSVSHINPVELHHPSLPSNRICFSADQPFGIPTPTSKQNFKFS
ncbi:hypothetical protein ACE6H2_012541 [Prunus campanulata]